MQMILLLSVSSYFRSAAGWLSVFLTLDVCFFAPPAVCMVLEQPMKKSKETLQPVLLLGELQWKSGAGCYFFKLSEDHTCQVLWRIWSMIRHLWRDAGVGPVYSVTHPHQGSLPPAKHLVAWKRSCNCTGDADTKSRFLGCLRGLGHTRRIFPVILMEWRDLQCHATKYTPVCWRSGLRGVERDSLGSGFLIY